MAVETDGATLTSDAGTTVAPPVVTPPADPKPTEPDKSTAVTGPVDGAPPKEPEVKVPEKYDLKLPGETLLDEGAIERTAAYAKEHGLSNDAAQEALNRHSQALTDHVDNQAKVWMAEAKADPQVGGEKYNENIQLARRVVAKYGNDAFRDMLEKWGYGENVEVIRVFAGIGKVMGEDKLVVGPTTGSTKPKTAQELMYPTLNKEK